MHKFTLASKDWGWGSCWRVATFLILILTFLILNVEIFKYKKIKTNFSFTSAISGHGQNS